MGTDPEILVPLTSARTGFEAETIAQALNAHGVPAQVFGLSAQVMQWELGYHDAIKVMVRRGDLETASDILKALKAESVDIDWSEVEVGEPPEDEHETIALPAKPNHWPRRVIWAVFIVAMLLIYWGLAIAAFGIAALYEFWVWSKREPAAAKPT